jgi:dimethylamine/trimethylamine dehydrogenase
MGEEWRKGWHPERIPPKASERSILVVGAGPAGLEAAMALGKRGYRVMLAEAGAELGGRVARESKLPGLAEWGRVRDWRATQLAKLSNVEIYFDRLLDAEQVKDFGADCVALATGALWRRDGVGRWHRKAISGSDRAHVLTPEDIMAGVEPVGAVIVFDDDHYYMGGVIAEKLRRDGHEVTLVTPNNEVSSWAHKTVEQGRIQQRLRDLEVRLETSTALVAILDGHVQLACMHSPQRRELEGTSVVMVTSRIPNDALYRELAGHLEIARIGDCDTPGTITTSVYAGHRYAREMDAGPPADIPFRREHARVP